MAYIAMPASGIAGNFTAFVIASHYYPKIYKIYTGLSFHFPEKFSQIVSSSIFFVHIITLLLFRLQSLNTLLLFFLIGG